MNTAVGNDRSSRLRQSLCRLRDETAKLLDIFLSRDQHVRGSVYLLRTKCGKPTCRCADGEALHSCMAITWTDAGRKRLRSLKPKEQAEMKSFTERYRRLRRERARLVKLQAQILDIVDKLEALRRRKP